MPEFNLTAPMAPQSPPLSSGYSKLAAALGRMTGCMIADGTRMTIGNESFSLMSMQVVLVEAGLDLIVMGAAQSANGDSSFIAMSDGSVWRVDASVKSGQLVTFGRKSDSDEVAKDCPIVTSFGEAVKLAAAAAIAKRCGMLEDDEIIGHVRANAHAAICMRAAAAGRLILQKPNGEVKAGFEVQLDAPPLASAETVLNSIRLRELTPSEIAIEKQQFKAAHGVDDNPFPMKMGLA